MLGTPGLKVAVASGPRSAYGLTKAAIRDEDPVVVLEPRPLYGQRELFEPNEEAVVSSAQARPQGRRRRDSRCPRPDSSVALGAANAAGNGAGRWSADVIDLRTSSRWTRSS